MDLGLKGKVAIVTGGASNIGRAISLGFVKEGAKVIIAEIDVQQGKKVIKEAGKLGPAPTLIEVDVTNNVMVEAMVKETLGLFGRIDVLVNNVGWAYNRPFLEKPREEWQKEVEINFWGMLNCTRAVIGYMVERKYGKIVSISSDAARMGELNEEVYSACKGAIISFSKSLARGFGQFGINVNVVCPGATNPESPEYFGEKSMFAAGGTLARITPQMIEKMAKKYPLGKLGKPEDIANAVLFFSSDVSGHITGQTLSVSGGYTMV
jgi:2-hydroxycyclohexanecarboxyl-CoA dehydrogenase